MYRSCPRQNLKSFLVAEQRCKKCAGEVSYNGSCQTGYTSDRIALYK